ncbi:hypothetical protein NDU88_007013 [Pleurodeles waltl]|uniref:Uncharacterized protein n=1 Tax=Pleurodeles waltl TaxID=8319 RepID=A0AAV7PSA9_PLEWA|nr:hypothetical protein NDU88_007013 [Pleurodeles waltl]
MLHHPGSYRSASLTTDPDLESGRARLPGLPVHYRTAARAAQPLITAPLGSHRLLQLHRPHHQHSKFLGWSDRPGANTHVILRLQLSPTRPRPQPVTKGNVVPRRGTRSSGHPPLQPTSSVRPGPGVTAPQPGPRRPRRPSLDPCLAPGGTRRQSANSPHLTILPRPRLCRGNSGCRGASRRGRPGVQASPSPRHTARPHRRSAQHAGCRPTRSRPNSSACHSSE